MLFADFLYYAMNQAELTNYKIAKEIGVSQTTIANWLNGTSEPRPKRRAEVLRLFGVDEYDLEEGFPKIHYIGKEKLPSAGERETTFDDFVYAMHEEAKDLSQEKKDILLQMARFMRQEEGKRSI